MTEQFLHGVNVIEVTSGARTVRTAKSSVIGVIGTAPDADEQKFPLNKPVLIAGSLKEAAKLGKTGTLPQAVSSIFTQVGATVVVIRVENADQEEEITAMSLEELMKKPGNIKEFKHS
ncbi:phage tail protein [Trichonephila clavata]|uniref:Phage tail protein n=1 Tax=Trichonephila clavata TaxID=2740835 RepID=A0A8X6GNE9_TRICU|nr:phage tail protein [Trichonephila clavata]